MLYLLFGKVVSTFGSWGKEALDLALFVLEEGVEVGNFCRVVFVLGLGFKECVVGFEVVKLFAFLLISVLISDLDLIDLRFCVFDFPD